MTPEQSELINAIQVATRCDFADACALADAIEEYVARLIEEERRGDER